MQIDLPLVVAKHSVDLELRVDLFPVDKGQMDVEIYAKTEVVGK